MDLKLAAKQEHLDPETGKPDGRITLYFHDAERGPAMLGELSPEQHRAFHASAIARGGDVGDLEKALPLLHAIQSTHAETSNSLADLHGQHQALSHLHDEMASRVADGTGASLEDVHGAVKSAAKALALAHQSQAVISGVSAVREQHMSALAQDVQARHAELHAEMHKALDAELADKRVEHADLSAQIEIHKDALAKAGIAIEAAPAAEAKVSPQ